MDDVENILNYYKDELKWNPPFADILSKYSPEGLKGYLVMRESVQNGHLPKKTSELIFTILDSLDNEVSGAKLKTIPRYFLLLQSLIQKLNEYIRVLVIQKLELFQTCIKQE
ncbi:hypothetical protein LL037_20230 [Clostridium estertheticum]|uniref:hypothetical protein n=1 Tax=Clostridium estertheticum TaxID=238834 RepID=UPI00209AC6C9|nr:hypothetical protein [Clostridium estertheticum]WAG64768.1 hypothetical protein LL037_20230 [Clostridium estertheticum]